MAPDDLEAIRERYAEFVAHQDASYGLPDGTAARYAHGAAIDCAHFVPALLAALSEAQRERDDLVLAVKARDVAVQEADRLRASMRQERDALKAFSAVLLSRRDETRDELRAAGWSTVAELHAAYLDVLDRWQRSEPVIEALRAWRAAGEKAINPAYRHEAIGADVTLTHAVDSYETQERTE